MFKKKRFKPLYQNFFILRENIQNRRKLLKFKRKKWEKLIKTYKRTLKRYKKFKPKNQTKLLVYRYPTKDKSYKQRYKNTLKNFKRLRLFFGNFRKKSIKKLILNIILIKKFKNRHAEFLGSLEKRLDVVLYRAKFCISLRNSQQLILHGKVLVNNKEIKAKSYKLKSGDLISIRSEYLKKIIENNNMKMKQVDIWPLPPKHLIINYKMMQIIFGDMEHNNLSTLLKFHFNVDKTLNKFV